MTTPGADPTDPARARLGDLALADLEAELATTRRVLERLPDEYLGWTPHPRAWTLGALAAHTATLVYWQTATVQHDGLDLATLPPPLAAGPASVGEVLEAFDRNVAALRGALAASDAAALTRDWTLRRGGDTIFTHPRVVVLRRMGVSHMVHHRAQLCVYLRLLGLPVPAVYGPSADEGSA